MMQFHNRPMSFGPVITTGSPLVSGEVGFPYSFQFQGTQGLPPYSWAVVSGTPPAGLSVSSSGMLFGTPTTPQASVFGLQITDSNGANSNISAFNMTVVAASVITTASPLPNANQATAYSTTIAATGVSPFIWSIPTQTGSNAWAINQNSGVLTGTPGTVEVDSITVQALDALGYPVQKVFSLTVVANQTATPTFSPPAGTYTSTQSVTISCSTPSSSIFYTTDGSTPTTGSTPFTAPISVASSETLKAIATTAGFTQSNVGSASYTIGAAAPTQQMKFASGFFNMSEGYQFSTKFNAGLPYVSGTHYVLGNTVMWTDSKSYICVTPTTGTQDPTNATYWNIGPASSQGGFLYDIALLAANYQTRFVGITYGFKASQLENYAATTNLALTPAASGGAAGATGAALQTAINTQYPNFKGQFELAFYTQQANVFGSLMGAIINFQQINHPNVTSAIMTGGWPNSTNATPADSLNHSSGSLDANGVLTVPTSYGATTTATYQQSPIYTGSTVYGMTFVGYQSGPNYFGGILGAWHNPGMNYRQRGQLIQALAQYQFSSGPAYSGATAYVIGNVVTSGGTSYLCIANTTGNAPPNATFWRVNPYAGQTVSQCPQVVWITDGDEWTFSFTTTGITGFPAGINAVGSSLYPLSGTNYRAAQLQFLAWKCAAFPTTPCGVWWSFGCNTYPGGAQDTNPLLAQMITDTIAAAGTTTYRPFVLSNADQTVMNAWNDKPGTTFPEANAFQQGYIGIRNPPLNNNPPTTPIVPVPATSSQGLANAMGTWEVFEYASQSGAGQPAPGPGNAGNPSANWGTIAGVERLLDELNFMSGTMLQLVATDESFGDINSSWNPFGSYIGPGLDAWITANKTTGNPYGLSNQLPVRWMYGPTIISATINSSTSATINWASITGQGTFNSASAAGIKLNVLRNGVQAAQVDAASGTFTDTSFTVGASYQLQMVNSNGTGPRGTAFVP